MARWSSRFSYLLSHTSSDSYWYLRLWPTHILQVDCGRAPRYTQDIARVHRHGDMSRFAWVDAVIVCKAVEGMRVATYDVRVLRPEKKLIRIGKEDDRGDFGLMSVSISHLSLVSGSPLIHAVDRVYLCASNDHAAGLTCCARPARDILGQMMSPRTWNARCRARPAYSLISHPEVVRYSG